MARQLIPLLALVGLLPLSARADEPADTRLYALASAGKLQLMGLSEISDLGGSTQVEVGAQLLPSLRLGLLLQASHHDVTHYELQAGQGGVVVPGDLALGQAGPVASWQPLEGAFQPGLRAQGGVAAWLSPMHPENWSEAQGWLDGAGVPTRGLGGWAALGGDLGVEVTPGGAVLQLSLDGGYLMAGPLTGPMAGGRIAFSAGF